MADKLTREDRQWLLHGKDERVRSKIPTHLPLDPSQKTKKEPSLLRDRPLGNWRFLSRTVVSFVVGLYFRTLPESSAEKTNCRKFLNEKTLLELMIMLFFC
jgi:hypothetical protein